MNRYCVWQRRWWYIKKRNARSFRMTLCLMTLIILCVSMVSYTTDVLMPTLLKISEQKVSTQVTHTIHQALYECFSKDITYPNIVKITRGVDGQLELLQADTRLLTKQMALFTETLQKKLAAFENSKIGIPFCKLFGDSILAGNGPIIYVKILRTDSVTAGLKSNFSTLGSHQIKHTLFVEVQVRTYITAPMTGKESMIHVRAPIAETVIIGSMPKVNIDHFP